MIERITPYCSGGSSLPHMIGVLCEGEEFEHPYVRKMELTAAIDEKMRLMAAVEEQAARISELEVQLDAAKELAADLFEQIRDVDNLAAWYEQRMRALGLEVE